jgi:hypothetical protein
MLEKLATLPTRLSHRQELRWLHRLHIIQLVGATFVFTMAIVRIGLRTNRIGINPAHPGGGASGWGAGVVSKGDSALCQITSADGQAVKSIIFVGYQLVTDAGQRFERFGSLKTNMVMNVLEVPFWFALLAITAGNLGTCVTPMCAINGIILGCSLILA